jgi:hypothetical protein
MEFASNHSSFPPKLKRQQMEGAFNLPNAVSRADQLDSSSSLLSLHADPNLLGSGSDFAPWTNSDTISASDAEHSLKSGLPSPELLTRSIIHSILSGSEHLRNTRMNPSVPVEDLSSFTTLPESLENMSTAQSFNVDLKPGNVNFSENERYLTDCSAQENSTPNATLNTTSEGGFSQVTGNLDMSGTRRSSKLAVTWPSGNETVNFFDFVSAAHSGNMAKDSASEMLNVDHDFADSNYAGPQLDDTYHTSLQHDRTQWISNSSFGTYPQMNEMVPKDVMTQFVGLFSPPCDTSYGFQPSTYYQDVHAEDDVDSMFILGSQRTSGAGLSSLNVSTTPDTGQTSLQSAKQPFPDSSPAPIQTTFHIVATASISSAPAYACMFSEQNFERSSNIGTVQGLRSTLNPRPPPREPTRQGDLMGNFETNPEPQSRKRKRKAFDPERKKKVKEVRDSGACVTCRAKKIPVSHSSYPVHKHLLIPLSALPMRFVMVV